MSEQEKSPKRKKVNFVYFIYLEQINEKRPRIRGYITSGIKLKKVIAFLKGEKVNIFYVKNQGYFLQVFLMNFITKVLQIQNNEEILAIQKILDEETKKKGKK
jgi:hypothetical protein